jgi:hypothetical protein
VKLTAFLDAAAPGLLLAQAIGRWGNYFNQELFGGPTTLPWGLQVDADNANFPPGMPVDTLFHPTFLYESLWNLAGVALLLVLDRRFNFRRGRLFWLYAMYYTLGRVWIEAMRIDDAEQINLFGITARLNVWTSIFVFVTALVVFIVLGRSKRKEDESVYLDGRSADAVGVSPDDDAEMHDAEVHADEENQNGKTIRHADKGVSDSESRDNLPDNQNGPGHASTSEAVNETSDGTTSRQGTKSAGSSSHQVTETAPEAGSTK